MNTVYPHNRGKYSRTGTIFKKELVTFLFTPTLYVCLALFVFLSNYLNFVVSHFFERGDASLAGSFFRWHPWLYAFFAPAISMRLWSEEYRQNTLELLLTMGFHPWQLVLGKFFCAWFMLLLALLLTFPLVITLYQLGPPDTGALITAYLGSALLCAAFVAVSIAAASLSRNQFISYILGASCCALLVMAGSQASINTLIRMFSDIAWPANIIAALSVGSHFKHFQQGVIAVDSVIYFVSTSALSLYFSQLLISIKRQ